MQGIQPRVHSTITSLCCYLMSNGNIMNVYAHQWEQRKEPHAVCHCLLRIKRVFFAATLIGQLSCSLRHSHWGIARGSRLHFSFAICHKISINWINLRKAQLQMRSKRESGMQSTDSVAAALAAVVLAATVFKSSLMTVAAVTTPVPPRRAKRAAADEADGEAAGCICLSAARPLWSLPHWCHVHWIRSPWLHFSWLLMFLFMTALPFSFAIPQTLPPHSSFPSAACSWLSSLSSSCLMSTLGISS